MNPELREAAVRMWTAAETLDAMRGGDTCWRWTHEQCARLYREGRAEDPGAVLEVARALEDRLARERQSRAASVE